MSTSENESADEPPGPQIVVPDHLITGTYAQNVLIHITPNEFTIDFVKFDPVAPSPGRGYVVARVTLPPLVMQQLPAVFDSAIEGWLERQTPSEAPPEAENESEADPD